MNKTKLKEVFLSVRSLFVHPHPMWFMKIEYLSEDKVLKLWVDKETEMS